MGDNPGLGFRPLGGLGLQKEQVGNGTGQFSPPSVYSSLIWFRHGAGGNWGEMKASMDLFLRSLSLLLLLLILSPSSSSFSSSSSPPPRRQYEPGYFPNQGASLTQCDFDTTPLSPKVGSSIPYHTIPYNTIPYHTLPYHTIPYQQHLLTTPILIKGGEMNDFPPFHCDTATPHYDP